MYGYGYPYGFYVDPTYVLLIIGMVLALAASGKMKSTFARYQQVRSHSSYRSSDCPEDFKCSRNLRRNDCSNFGSLTDHYDPRTKEAGTFTGRIWKNFCGSCMCRCP